MPNPGPMFPMVAATAASGIPNAFVAAWDLWVAKGKTSHYGGGIDDVRFYSRALNETEIRENYRGNVTRVGLVGEWRMDAGSGSSAAHLYH